MEDVDIDLRPNIFGLPVLTTRPHW